MVVYVQPYDYRLIACIIITSVDNTAEENCSVFSLIQMRWLPSAMACGQLNFAITKSSISSLEVPANAGWPV